MLNTHTHARTHTHRHTHTHTSTYTCYANAENIGSLPPFPYIETLWVYSIWHYEHMYSKLYYICHSIPLHHSSLTYSLLSPVSGGVHFSKQMTSWRRNPWVEGSFDLYK